MVKRLVVSVSSGLAIVGMILSTGTARADYAGQTYAQVAEDIAKRGGTAVISSRKGSYLPTDKCIVTRAQAVSFLDSSGRSSGQKITLDLDCDDVVAGAHAGRSAATPEGKKARQLRDMAADINEDFTKATAEGLVPWCAAEATRFRYCMSICKQSGMCSSELLQFLG